MLFCISCWHRSHFINVFSYFMLTPFSFHFTFYSFNFTFSINFIVLYFLIQDNSLFVYQFIRSRVLSTSRRFFSSPRHKLKIKMPGLGQLRMNGKKLFQEDLFFRNPHKYDSLSAAWPDAAQYWANFLTTSQKNKWALTVFFWIEYSFFHK